MTRRRERLSWRTVDAMSLVLGTIVIVGAGFWLFHAITPF